MAHTELIEKFKEICRINVEDFEHWFPNGKDSIRVRFDEYTDVVFTYHSEKDWRIESMDSYLMSIKG